jgi:hypothetical protein
MWSRLSVGTSLNRLYAAKRCRWAADAGNSVYLNGVRYALTPGPRLAPPLRVSDRREPEPT